MKKIITIIILCLMLCGCNNSTIEKENILKEQIEDIKKTNNYILIDVRTKEEYDISHIENAINIPYDEIDESINIDKNKVIFVYCKSGNRSSIAYNKFKELGYNVYDLGAYSKININF